MTVGGSLGAKKNLRFLCLCVCLLFRLGWSEVLIKYTGKYVKIYFIIKITFLISALFKTRRFKSTFWQVFGRQIKGQRI